MKAPNQNPEYATDGRRYFTEAWVGLCVQFTPVSCLARSTQSHFVRNNNK